MSLILGLWSVVLEPGKTYSQTTTPSIQITNVSFGANVIGSDRSVVTIKYPEFEQEDSEDEDEEDDDDDEIIKLPKMITKEAVLAILKPNQTEQVSINITLVEDVEVVEFAVSGPNAVHLMGHYVRQEDFDQDPYSDSEDGEFDSDDESIDSNMLGDDDSMEGLSGMIGGEDDDSADEDPTRFAEIKEIIKEGKKAAASNPKKRAAEDEDVAASLLKGDADDADASMSSTLSKNQKKKLAKKLKGPDGAAAAAPAAAEEKKAATKASPEKKENKVEASPAAKKEGPKPVTLPGGLIIVDSKKGDGAVAKSGKKVGMRYIGKLDNGKIFDSNTKGSPLVFTLGRGEVIKGWDQGVAGMAVGGERKLTIPAALAYGKKGTQGIPGNATLHFDVKLVTLK